MNPAVTLVDVALASLGVELLVLIIVRIRGGRGPRPAAVLGGLLAGAALLAALRAALVGPAWPLVPVFLLLALFAHGWDTWSRWRGDGYN